LTGEGAGRVLSPEIGRCSGADALRTRGRPHWPDRYGEGWADLAGSQTHGMYRHMLRGTREALCPIWNIAARSAR
jgi:hypothetical protein